MQKLKIAIAVILWIIFLSLPTINNLYAVDFPDAWENTNVITIQKVDGKVFLRVPGFCWWFYETQIADIPETENNLTEFLNSQPNADLVCDAPPVVAYNRGYETRPLYDSSKTRIIGRVPVGTPCSDLACVNNDCSQGLASSLPAIGKQWRWVELNDIRGISYCEPQY